MHLPLPLMNINVPQRKMQCSRTATGNKIFQLEPSCQHIPEPVEEEAEEVCLINDFVNATTSGRCREQKQKEIN